ncbi:hypothetical protein [Haloplanus aerogenes]|uniref:Uncharacterized protein n=1 Tax=Haloplanus aerogenes TaxID=660522 RepID=A0A3M0DR23_9EURY|nr:hypothetical protein [Haloplanus aerogenes]AZH24339.1 hypothetical protein DU502_02635 [Haloplanus aerogenes]RMB24027.1 hypothetical protein ATH50_1260 [Haloplanus aerogenes]
MRPITRRALIGFALVCLALLALGALPTYLGAGEPYYLTATPTDDSGPAVNVTDLSERRYPYLTGAIESGRSDPYRRGPIGLKESFTHSPFDEREGLVARNPDARRDGGVLVTDGGERYLVAVTQA